MAILTEEQDHLTELTNNIQSMLNDHTPLVLTDREKQVISMVKHTTKQANRNNLTRTNAYLRFFSNHQEIHWSFLAHMVSRNGGYNMTDLKGSLLSPLLKDEQKTILFHFLERANFLIFHDAYPQLLLYEISKNEEVPLFHLLPAFNVSKFMIPIWEDFYLNQHSELLTYGLITNEQQYIEKHLLSLDLTKKAVLQSLSYLLQDRLGFTHVIFPYKKYSFLSRFSLAGKEIKDFSDVKNRIKIGKQLYHLLFTKNRIQSFLSFAFKVEHTGSREDYWPAIFSSKKHSSKHVSPKLSKVWNNVHHSMFKRQDWFTHWDLGKTWFVQEEHTFRDITKNVKKDIALLSTLSKAKTILS
ncbi:DUF2515 family protein [Metabacillus sp. HB246100]